MASSTEPMGKLKDVGQDVLKSLSERAISGVSDRVSGLSDKFEDIGNGGPIGKAVAKGGEAAATGKSPVGGALKGAVEGIKDKVTGGGGGGSKSPKATKAMNIVEELDVGVPIRVAYNQWTAFDQFPSFMKKVEHADEEDFDEGDESKVKWKAQVFWSHREWEATIKEQVPDERIVWTSTGQKGHVDGAVTFHELGPNLTRILLVLEYYPQGFMERTGNIWRAAGRRARLEFKHFRRHVMTRTILDPDEVEGWRGTIHDGEVVQTHEEALEEEQQEQDDQEGQDDQEPEGEYDEEESDEEESDAEYDEPDEEEPEDEYDEDEPDEEEPDEEYEEDTRRAS